MTKIDIKKVIGSLKSKDRQYNENLKDAKGVMRSLKWTKDRQYIGQKYKHWSTKHYTEN